MKKTLPDHLIRALQASAWFVQLEKVKVYKWQEDTDEETKYRRRAGLADVLIRLGDHFSRRPV